MNSSSSSFDQNQFEGSVNRLDDDISNYVNQRQRIEHLRRTREGTQRRNVKSSGGIMRRIEN